MVAPSGLSAGYTGMEIHSSGEASWEVLASTVGGVCPVRGGEGQRDDGNTGSDQGPGGVAASARLVRRCCGRWSAMLRVGLGGGR